jgi:hypothetical protein
VEELSPIDGLDSRPSAEHLQETEGGGRRRRWTRRRRRRW